MEIHIKNYLKATGKSPNDRFLCEKCGKSFKISFHHLIFRSHGGTDDFENIMCLCGDCHDKAHGIQLPKLSYEILKAKHMELVHFIQSLL